jgi:protease-4
MAPEDLLDLKGLRAELTYVKGTLDKIGVQVEIEHAGKYKDAGDMFTRKNASPETLEVMNSVLDDLYGQLTGRLAAGRHKSPEQVRAIIDQGPFIAKEALAAGLVDGLEYQDQVYADLRQRLKVPEVRKVAVRDYQKVSPQSLGLDNGRKVALVVAEGDIVRGDSDSPFGGEGFVSSAGMTRLLDQVRDDASIRGVIVRIDSPGGDAFASDEIWRAMGLLSKKKPVVISMSDYAASGGYYMAMTGDPILAYPGTLTGSIGVFYGKADLHGLYEKIGIQKQILSRGRFAEIDSDYKPLSAAEREKVHSSIEAFYQTFIARVAEGRKRPAGQIEPVAQGRVWLGSQAKANGLVDGFGGLDAAITLVKQRAGIPATEKVRLAAYPPRRTIFDQLFNATPAVELPQSKLFGLLRRFSTRTWTEGGYFRAMPYSIEIK